MIETNCFIIKNNPFKSFKVHQFLIQNPITTTEVYDIIRQLSGSDVSDSSYRNKILYTKGDHQKTQDLLERIGYIIEDLGSTGINPFDFDENILREIFYLVLDRLALNNGFYPIRKIKRDGKKRIIPNIFENFDRYEELGLVHIIDKNGEICIARGLWFFLDFYKNNDVLWIDVYSPLVSLKDKRLISPREAKKKGLREKYISYIPTSSERRQLLEKLIREFFKDEVLGKIFFLDEDYVEIDLNPIRIGIEEDSRHELCI